MYTENIDELYKKKNDLFSFINQYCKFFGKDTLINLSKLLYEDHGTKEISYMEHNIIGPYFNNEECRLNVQYNMGQIYMSFTVPFIVSKGITADAQDVINDLQFYINNKYVYGTMSMMDPVKNRIKQIISHMEEKAQEELYKFLQHYFDGEEIYEGSAISYRYTFGIHLDFIVDYFCNINNIPQFRIFISEKNPMYNPYNTLFQYPYPVYNGFGGYYHDPMPYYGGLLPNNEIKSITLSIVDLYEMIHNDTNYKVEENNKEDKEEEKEEYRDLSDSIHKKRMELEKEEAEKEEHEKITIRNKARLLDFLLYANNKEPVKKINNKVEKENHYIEIPIVSRGIKYTIHLSYDIYAERYFVSAYETAKKDHGKAFGFYMKTEDIIDVFHIIFAVNKVTEYYFITLAEQLFDTIKRNPSITDSKEFFNTLKSALHQEKKQTLDIIDGLKLDIVPDKLIAPCKQLNLYYSIGFSTSILRTFIIDKKEIDETLDLIYYMHFTDEE